MDSAKKTIHNSDSFERYTYSVKPDAVLVCGALSTAQPLLTLGKYATEAEAREVLAELFAALGGGATYFEMPDSVLFHGERKVKDARTRRRGGS